MCKVTGWISLVLLLSSAVLPAQALDSYVTGGLEQKDITRQLPTLDSLLVLAREHSPLLKYHGANQEYWEGEVALARRDWLRHLNLDAAYGYGIFDNLSNQQIAGDPGNQTLFSSEQSRYTFGASMKVPLDAVFNRNRKVKNAKAEAAKSRFEQEFAVMELEQLVIRQYNDLVRAHRLFFIVGSQVESYRVQSLRAEKDFANGSINVTEYTRLQQMLNNSVQSFEDQRSEYLTALMLLENTVGVTLNL